jgi:hypothetical protein
MKLGGLLMNLDQVSIPAERKIRIGEFLLKAQIITKNQLDEAIEYQCIYGGKLGTCLIELGFVDEWQFAQMLSKYHNLDYVEPYELMNVPQKIIDLIPRQIAIANLAVPYRVDHNKLFVVISEASDIYTIERLAKATGHIIIPMTLPEIRLKQALKKHYDMPLPTRYQSLVSRLNKRQQALNKRAQTFSPKTTLSSTNTLRPTNSKKNEVSADSSTWPLLGEHTQENDHNEQKPITDHIKKNKPSRKKKFLQQLANISSRDELAKTLIDFMSTQFSTCALWIVRDQTICGWTCNKKSDEDFDQLQLKIGHQSLIGTAVSSGQPQLGPAQAPDDKLNKFFSDSPTQALAIPLAVRERIVCVFYLQDELAKLQKNQKELIAIAHKIELTFSMLILKNKILET